MYITERLTVNNVTGASSPGETGAASGVGTATVFETDLTAANNYFNGMTIRFTSGANRGETKPIDDYTLANGQITVDSAFTAAPGAADTFIIEPTSTIFQTDLTAVDDFYNGMEIEFTSGPCKGQRATILDYAQDNGQITLTQKGIASGVGTATIFQTDLTAANNFYNGMTIRFTSGNNADETRIINGYILATGQITVDSAFTAAPAAGNDFIIERTDTLSQGLASGVGTATVFETDLTAPNDYFNGMTIKFTSGMNTDESRLISDYALANGEITIAVNFLVVPALGDEFTIEPTDTNILSRNPRAARFIIWTELGIDGPLIFDLPITSRFCKIVYIGIVQLTPGPMSMNFEIWESTAARLFPNTRANLYQKIINRRITETQTQGGEYGETLADGPMPYYDRDAVDQESTFRLHCRLENDVSKGTESDFSVTVKIADMGENV